MMDRTDKRLRLINDLINGIKVIKIYAWENLFAKFINYNRE